MKLLVEKYGMKLNDAAELVSKMANELQVERNVKKSTEIKINPGFKTTVKLDSSKGKITISVENINDISYLNTIPVYLDSFIRLTQNKSSTKISSKEIDALCSKQKKKEVVLNDIISLEEEIPSKQEIPFIDGETIEYEKESELEEVNEDFDSDDDRPKNALDLFYDDDFEYDDNGYEDYESENEMAGGDIPEEDSESEPEEENELIQIDGNSLTNPNPFFKK